MKPVFTSLILVAGCFFTGCAQTSYNAATAVSTQNRPSLVAPPQDQGLPYTRSARPQAIERIRDYTAVFAGSRYAYVQGLKVRLDEKNWRDEALIRDGVIYVPEAFAPSAAIRKVKADTAPEYLASRWVYTIELPKTEIPETAKRITVDGRPYVSLTDVARSQGLTVTQDSRGLLLMGRTHFESGKLSRAQLDAIITLFDTPEKLADPDIATEYLPGLKQQGKWTDHVKVTAAQLAMLNGPETKWEMTPESQFDFTGFDKGLLGSEVPPSGVYPRVLFSEKDIPMLAERIRNSKLGQRSIIEVEYLLRNSFWDPRTSDGQVFQKLYTGELAGLEWPDLAPDAGISGTPQQFKGQKPGIYSSHIAYIPECLTNMALYCLLTNDNEHGRQAAAAIANYFKLREPLIDEWNSTSDSEFNTGYIRTNGKYAKMNGDGAETHWRGMHGVVPNMNLGLALDFGGKWMTAEEKDLMRRIIAKATYGRRPYGQDGSQRFRDINWMTWDLPQFLALAAIEGLEGFDKEGYESNAQSIRAFCEWGIDDSGVIYESNGKTGGGCQHHFLAMVALARRGENLFGHPHFRKLLQGQIQMTSPDGRVVVNSGTQYIPFSQQVYSLQIVDELKAFYPSERYADYLLSNAASGDDDYWRGWKMIGFSPEAYRTQVRDVRQLRMPSPMYPSFVNSYLYSADFQPTTRADLKLPLDFSDPTHGVFSSYSNASTDAVWINMMVRPDHYLGAGHHHADAGMFHFSALGVNWFTESPFPQNYAGKYHNQVLVDGISEPEANGGNGTAYQGAATYLGATANRDAAAASADLTYSYTYRWQTQPGKAWPSGNEALDWEFEPSPEIAKIFAGTARYKMRPWWPTYTWGNYIATSRAKFNPMKYVYRSTGLVRGEHPYAFVVDDLMKDVRPHLYQWTAMLSGGVWQASMPGLQSNQIVLGFREKDFNVQATPDKPRTLIAPQKGEPLILACILGYAESAKPDMPLMKVETVAGPEDKNGKPQYYDRIAINRQGKQAHFRVLLLPMRMGDAMPIVSYDASKATATVTWQSQQDDIVFTQGKDGRTLVTVSRSGNIILEAK